MISLEERYAVAASLAPGCRDTALRHGPVRPRWSADSAWLWYETQSRDGIEHVRINVSRRIQEPLFHHEALASALGQATGELVVANMLPIARVVFDPATGTVGFSTTDSRWHWQDSTHRLDRIGAAFASHELASPDEQYAVFLDGPNLWLRAAQSTESIALTDDGLLHFGWGDFIDYTMSMTRRVFGPTPRPHAVWSPDSTRIAVLRVDRRQLESQHLVQSVPARGVRPAVHSDPFPMFGDPVEAAPTEVWFVGLDGKRIRANVGVLGSFSHSPFFLGQGRWSDDGRHFWIVDNNRAGTSISLWRIDSRDGYAERVAHEDGPGIVRAAPTLGMDPLYEPLADGRILWWSQRDGWGHLWLLARDGSAMQVTRGEWQVRELLHVDVSSERIVFAAGGREPGIDPYFRIIYSIRFDGSDLRRLTPDLVEHEAYREMPRGLGELERLQTMSPDGSSFVDVGSTVASPPISVLRDGRTGELMLELERGDDAGSWPTALPLPEPTTLPSLDSSLGAARDLWGLLYKPLDFDPACRYPVIEVIYAGPQMSVVPKGWQPSRQASVCEQLAALGFVVFIIDGPGTPLRSHIFQLASHGRIESCGNLPDHVAALEALAKGRPWLDLNRVGIVGGSAGGFATVRAMADRPDFYRAGVALCGSHDSTANIPFWGETFQGPYDVETYARQDNARIAHRISGALLLVHGEMDDTVAPANTLRVVDALIRANRDFELLIVPNTGHILTLSRYVMRRVFDFFVRKLMHVAPPPAVPTLPVEL